MVYLWRAVDAEGEVLDMLVQSKRNKHAALRLTRFPPEIIHQAIWLYLRFTLSFRDVEDLLAERYTGWLIFVMLHGYPAFKSTSKPCAP